MERPTYQCLALPALLPRRVPAAHQADGRNLQQDDQDTLQASLGQRHCASKDPQYSHPLHQVMDHGALDLNSDHALGTCD